MKSVSQLHRRFEKTCVILVLLLASCAATSNLFAGENTIGREVQTISFPDVVGPIAWSPDQRYMAVKNITGKHYLYDLAKDEILWTALSPSNDDNSDLFDPTSHFVLSASFPNYELNKTKTIVYAETPVETGQMQYVTDPSFEDPSFENLQNMQHSVPRVLTLALSPDASTLASVKTVSDSVGLYDTRSWKLTKHLGPMSDFSKIFIDQTRQVLVGGSPFYVQVWNSKTNKEITRFQPYPEANTARLLDPITAMAVNYEMGTIITGAQGYGPATKRFFEAEARRSNNPDLIPNRELNWSTTVRGWDMVTGKRVITYNAPGEGKVTALSVSADGKLIAAVRGSGEFGKHVFLWNASTGELIGDMEYGNHHSGSSGIAFSPDGKRLAYGVDSTIHIVELTENIAQ